MKDNLKALADKYLDPVSHYNKTGETLLSINVAKRCEVIPVPNLRQVSDNDTIGGIVIVISGDDINGNPCEILYTVSVEDADAIIKQQLNAVVALKNFRRNESWKLN